MARQRRRTMRKVPVAAHGNFEIDESGTREPSALFPCGLTHMGYLTALVLVVLVIPLLFVILSRRSTGAGGIDSTNRGLTPNQPAADEPTPRAGPGVDRHIPPS